MEKIIFSAIIWAGLAYLYYSIICFLNEWTKFFKTHKVEVDIKNINNHLHIKDEKDFNDIMNLLRVMAKSEAEKLMKKTS